jgi:hypothetical protein
MLPYDAEPLRIGLVAAPDAVPRFRHMWPQARWYSYASLAVCAQDGEHDGVEILVVDVAHVERCGEICWESLASLRIPVAPALLDMLCNRYPLLAILAPESALAPWIATKGVTILCEPVETAALREALAAHADAIQRQRLRRLFQQVAETFIRDTTP